MGRCTAPTARGASQLESLAQTVSNKESPEGHGICRPGLPQKQAYTSLPQEGSRVLVPAQGQQGRGVEGGLDLEH